MSNLGVLLVLMQPPPAFEDEFNAWYDSEHVPERLSVPGFLSGRRFVCLDGHPKYLALYDIENVAVLDGPAYAAVSGDRFSPWTKRVTSRVRVYRSAGTQAYPGRATTGRHARLRLLRFRDLPATAEAAIVSGMQGLAADMAGVVQVRVFTCPVAGGCDFYGLVETSATIENSVDTSRYGAHAAAIDMINVYANY